MFIESLRVQGFKSLADVTLADLSTINIFHGLNDVGKSNILQAIDLFFQLLPEAARAFTGDDEADRSIGLKNADLQPYTPSVFRQGGDGQITWEAHIRIAADTPPAWLRLRLVNAREGLKLALEWEKPVRFAGQPEDIAIRWLHEVCADPTSDFTLVTAERRFTDEWMGEETAPIDYTPYQRHGSPVEPARLKQVLFEAVPHRDLQQRGRFKRLAQILNEQFGVGELDITWDEPRELERRMSESSRYVRDIVVRFLRPDMPEALGLADVGSGVQQLILLLGQMLLNPARSVGIEEPEMNLSPDWQVKLLEVLRELVKPTTDGLEQLFITSHSLAFRPDSADYYDVEYDPQARVTLVTRRPVEERQKYFKPLGLTLTEGEELGPYLNPQGQITLPQRVIKDLGVCPYEPVFFVREGEYWRLRTKQEIIQLAEAAKEQASDNSESSLR